MKMIVALISSAFLFVSAQTSLGNWIRQDLDDPFVDEERIVLAIGERGERYSGEGPLFAVLCEDRLADVVYFNVNRVLSNGEVREFDYRVNGGDIQTLEGWTDQGFVSLRTGEDDFAKFKEDVLVDGAEIAIAATSTNGGRIVTVFKLAGLDSALENVGCVK